MCNESGSLDHTDEVTPAHLDTPDPERVQKTIGVEAKEKRQ
jgi:hypothetical protein